MASPSPFEKRFRCRTRPIHRRMKKLAKDKMLRALSNVDYAKGDYEKEMGQAALKKEALNKNNL